MRISEWSSDVCSSDLWYALPEAGVGAVILTNADPGAAMLGPFLRRLLEVLYDGQPEAARDVATAAARNKAQAEARRERLLFPRDPAVLAKLARQYRAPEVDHISIGEQGGPARNQDGLVAGPDTSPHHPAGRVANSTGG